MVGEDCSQPPDGVAEIMLPAASTTSMCTVSPHTAPDRPSVGSPRPGPPGRPRAGSSRWTWAGSRGTSPSGDPGRNSSDAVSVISARRSAL
jgi:hypothetical protein